MDPAHGPYVHRSWWWRTKRSMHEKAKPFGPSSLGFTMRRHRPSSNSRAYLLVGGVPETEIAFRLPGVRIEHVSTGRHHLVGLTAVTPVDEQRTEITQAFYWTMPWLSVARPAVDPVEGGRAEAAEVELGAMRLLGVLDEVALQLATPALAPGLLDLALQLP